MVCLKSLVSGLLWVSAVTIASPQGDTHSLATILPVLEYSDSLVQNLDVCAETVDFTRELGPPDPLYNVRREQKERWVYDKAGRVRREKDESSTAYRGGKKVQTVFTWDNNKSMFLDGHSRVRTVIISSTDDLSRIRKPTDFAKVDGVPVGDSIKALLEDAGSVTVTTLDSGAVSVTMTGYSDRPSKKVCMQLEPNKLYYMSELCIYEDDKSVHKETSVPCRYGDDIWLPKKGHRQKFRYIDGKQVLDYEAETTIQKVEVNVTDLKPELFEVELTPDTVIKDLRAAVPGKPRGSE